MGVETILMNLRTILISSLFVVAVQAQAVMVEFEINSLVAVENSFMAYFDQSGGMRFAHVGAFGDGSVRKLVDFDSFAGDGSVRIALLAKYAPGSSGLDGGALLSVVPDAASRFRGASWESLFDSTGGSGDLSEAEYLALLGDGSVLPNPAAMGLFLDQNLGNLHGAPSLELFAFTDGAPVGSIAVVPEPFTMGLLGVGLAALARRRRVG